MARRADGDPIRVLIVDDHPLVRDGTGLYLEQAEGIAVVGAAGTGERGRELVRQLRPDVLILDIQLPDQSGVEVAREVRAADPRVAILVLTGFDDPGYLRRLRQVGIQGYLLKTASREEVVGAVRAVAGGRTVTIAGSPMRAGSAEETLTAREHEVLQLLARGLSNDEIAGALVVSTKTVEFHVSHLLRKLDARSRLQAIARARQRGLAIDDAGAPDDPPSRAC